MATEKIKTITPEARIAFPSIFKKAKAFKEGQPEKYEVTLLFDKKTDLKPLRALCDEAAKKRWGQLPKGLKLPFRNGDDKETNGYAGTVYAHAKSSYAPAVIDKNKQDIINEEDLYAGCYCKASIIVDTYEQKDEQGRVLGKGVKFLLRALMKTREGEPLVQKVNAAEDFNDEAANDASNYDDAGDDLSDLGL